MNKCPSSMVIAKHIWALVQFFSYTMKWEKVSKQHNENGSVAMFFFFFLNLFLKESSYHITITLILISFLASTIYAKHAEHHSFSF